MKLSLVRVLPLALALLVPSAALAEEHGGQAGGSTPPSAAHKVHAARTPKRAKAGAKAPKAAKATKTPKAAKATKAPKAAKKAPKAAKKAAK
jgi:hypothetical protein